MIALPVNEGAADVEHVERKQAMRIWNVARLLGMVAFAVIATACSTPTTPDGRLKERTTDYWWREEVKLSTGQVIVVTRGESRVMRGEMGRGSGLMFYSGWLEADLPGVGKTRWEGTITPLVLDVTSKGVWYLLAAVATEQGRRDYGLAESNLYVAFQLREGKWQRVPFKEFPEEFTPNVLANRGDFFFGKDAPPSGYFMNLQTKNRLDSSKLLYEKYRSIDRSRGE
jgi:hypothetical protein